MTQIREVYYSLGPRTKISANNDGDLAFAFDVCQYGSYPVANVTMMDAEITGKAYPEDGDVSAQEALEELKEVLA